MEELLPHDIIESILERLDVKTLLKFTTVSKQWKSTIIRCRSFQTRQMLHRKQSGKTDVVLVYDGYTYYYDSSPRIEVLRTLVVGSTVSVKIPTNWEKKFYLICNTSCDGLICLSDRYDSSIVVNPTTRWHRTIPPCNYQLEAFWRKIRQPSLGFGKDKIKGTYKAVWLYNSVEFGLKNKSITTCEVFDFTTNAWRYVVPASPYLIHEKQGPVYCDGSLHWLTAGGETNVLSLDLHTEIFQVIPQPPFLHDSYHGLYTPNLAMCSLDDRLCLSDRIGPEQVMWSFDSEDKTWNKIYSVDQRTYAWSRNNMWKKLTPLSVLGKDKLLFYDGESSDGPLVAFDLRTKYYDIAYKCKLEAYNVLCYVPSLISIL